jgi:branched-chain amino acid transport system substrate-binding protein
MRGVLPRDIFFLGFDGIVDAQCIKDAGDYANEKMYATVDVADPTQSADSAVRRIVEGYKAAFPNKEDVNAYTFAAYDCARILIDAIGRAIDANGGKMPTRPQIVDAVAQTQNLKGATGTYTFDKYGDPLVAVMSIFQVKDRAWAFSSQFTVGSPGATGG